MVITMNMYSEIRKMALAGMSQRKISKQTGISRPTVKKYLEGGCVPWEREAYSREPEIMTDEVENFIISCLEEDKTAPKKQNHTARRIFHRLQTEHNFQGGESTVRATVRRLKQKQSEVYVPLDFPPGDALQIDWGEATIYLKGKKTLVYLFCARFSYSAAPFVIAYRRQNQESFLHALVEIFKYFQGVPKKIIFDNAKVAVKSGFGAHAVQQEEYAKLSAHYGFEPIFCNVASGNEKGLVEGLVGLIRRNTCSPVPRVESLDELNKIFENYCDNYLNHKISGKKDTVGAMFMEEKKALHPLPPYIFDTAKSQSHRVDSFATVRFEKNSYSVPVEYGGKMVGVKVYPEEIKIYHDGQVIATHCRCFEKAQSIYQLEHYLPLLERKGRAIPYAKPVKDNVSPEFMAWLEEKQLKPKEMVELLRRCCEIGCDNVMKENSQCQATSVVNNANITDVESGSNVTEVENGSNFTDVENGTNNTPDSKNTKKESTMTEEKEIPVTLMDLTCYDLLLLRGEVKK